VEQDEAVTEHRVFHGFRDGERVEYRRRRQVGDGQQGTVSAEVAARRWPDGYSASYVPVLFDDGGDDGVLPTFLHRITYSSFQTGERVRWERRGLGVVIDPRGEQSSTFGHLLSDMLEENPGHVPIRFDNGYQSVIRAEAVESMCPRKRNR
jgi:hypothetical protein